MPGRKGMKARYLFLTRKGEAILRAVAAGRYKFAKRGDNRRRKFPSMMDYADGLPPKARKEYVDELAAMAAYYAEKYKRPLRAKRRKRG